MIDDSKLLQPLSTVVSAVLRVVVGLLVVGVVLSLVRPGLHMGWSSGETCVGAPWVSGTVNGVDALFGAHGTVHVDAIPRYCATRPTHGQEFLQILGRLPSIALLIGGLFLLNRLLQTAVNGGPYTVRTSSGMRALGWWLLLGSITAAAIEATAKTALLATLTDKVPLSAGTWLQTWKTPYLAVLTAIGLLVFAQTLKGGAAMREDIEGTI